jgi:SET and MYND domain-containing protein 4
MEDFKKNEKSALTFRIQGNREFKKRNYFEALLFYNKSLCFAEKPETSSLCYVSRADVYLKLKLYEHCLSNIKLARKNYSKEKLEKLDEREEKCLSEHLAALETKTIDSNAALVSDFLKLSYPANPKLPFAAECLELKENEKFGRHIVTNRNLKAGDIIAITPNICNIINRPARFHHCSFCLRSNEMDLIPCSECSRGENKFQLFQLLIVTFYLNITALYCSRKCMVADRDELHSVYCGNSSVFDSRNEIATRIGLRCLNKFYRIEEIGIDELGKLLTETKLYNVFDFDFSNCHNPQLCKNMMLAALGGQKLSKELETFDKTDILNFYTNVVNNLWSRFSLLIDHLEPYTLATKKILNEGDPPDVCEHVVLSNPIGFIFHPLELMFNASCHPNLQVARFTEQGVSAWIIKYPVKAGDQVFVRYERKNQWLEDKTERQKIWKDYGFECECKACVNDWKFSEIRDHYKMKCQVSEPSIKPEEAKKKFKENCKYINKNYKKEYPSGELRNKKKKLKL